MTPSTAPAWPSRSPTCGGGAAGAARRRGGGAARRGGGGWGRAAGVLAAELSAAGAMRVGLELVGGGRELADEIGLGDDAPRSVRLSASSPPRTARGIELLVATRGARARAALVARKLAPSPAFMRAREPIA